MRDLDHDRAPCRIARGIPRLDGHRVGTPGSKPRALPAHADRAGTEAHIPWGVPVAEPVVGLVAADRNDPDARGRVAEIGRCDLQVCAQGEAHASVVGWPETDAL